MQITLFATKPSKIISISCCFYAVALDDSTGFLMNGTTADLAPEKITDKTFINQFNPITELSEENKIVISKLIDAFLFLQERMQKLAQ